MEHIGAYFGLFAASFLSATVFPIQSEVALFGMLLAEHYQWVLLVLVASIGNTLGSIANWVLGHFFSHLEGGRWFTVPREKMARSESFYRRYGRWSLLLSWLPIVGDALTIIVGVLRKSLAVFISLVGTAKAARYFAVAALILGWI